MKLRIVEVPYRYDERHDGLGRGPRALLDAGLVDRLRETPVGTPDVVTAELPESERVDGPVAVNIGRLGANVGALVGEGHDRDERVLVLAGDDTAAVGVVSGLQQSRGAAHRIGVVWFDAHGDFNTPTISPSGNLHGMALALLCGEDEFDDAFGGAWRAEVNPANVTLFGTRSIDPGQRALLVERGVEVIDMRTIDENGATLPIRRFIERVQEADGHLHVSLDVDAMDPSLAPAVGTLVPGGLTYREAHLVMEMLHDAEVVGSLDIVELNPFMDHAGRSALLLVDLAASLFGRRIMSRRR